MQGLFFYTEGRVIQAETDGVYGELQFGARAAPDAADFFWSGKRRLSERWRSGQHMFIVTADDGERDLAAFLDPAPRVLARDGYRVVLVNFSPMSSPTAAIAARVAAEEPDVPRKRSCVAARGRRG